MRRMEQYDASYFESTHGNWFRHPHIWLFEMLHARLSRLGPNASILDIGCGRGDFLRWLRVREPTWTLTGTDLSPNVPESGITFEQGDILTQPLSQRFDAVVNLAVIEHVADIQAFCATLVAHGRPGGTVVIMTNNDSSVVYDIARALNRVGAPAAFERVYSPHHLNHFTVRSLRTLVESQGLVVRETVLHNTPLNTVDMPDAGAVKSAIWKCGVWGAFTLGRLTGKTFMQTIVCQVPIGTSLPGDHVSAASL